MTTPRALLGVFAALHCTAALADDREDEARTAACIDRYNTDPAFRDAQNDILENPALTLRIRPVGLSLGSADGNDTGGSGRRAYGGGFDADTLITLITGGHTRTGLTAGISGTGYWTPDRTYAFGGEVRLGIGRRRYGVPLLESKVLRFIRPSKCRFERLDLGLDLFRWRVHWVTNTQTPGQPTTFVSSIATVVPSLRFSYADWGWRVMLSVTDVRMVPSVSWGASVGLEAFWHLLSISVLGGGYLDHAYVTANLGLRFEFGTGLSLN